MIGIRIIGAESVVARFQGATERVRAALTATTMRLAIEAQRKVMAEKLSGQVLHVRTDRLRASVNVQPISEAGRIGASTGTNVSYGAYWELGFRRRVGAGARGGPHGLSTDALARYTAKHPAGMRQYGPRSFLSPVLSEMRAQAREQMTAAAKGAI